MTKGCLSFNQKLLKLRFFRGREVVKRLHKPSYDWCHYRFPFVIATSFHTNCTLKPFLLVLLDIRGMATQDTASIHGKRSVFPCR